MKRFPHPNAQFIAVLVFAVSALGALAIFQGSSLSTYLRAVPIPPDGACYIGFPLPEDGKPLTQCLRTTTAEKCRDEARGKPYLFVPDGLCPNATTANMCERAGVELVESFGEGQAPTEEESVKIARDACRTNLMKRSKLACPNGCSAYLKYYADPGCKTGVPANNPNLFGAECHCWGMVACNQVQPGIASPEPMPVPFPFVDPQAIIDAIKEGIK